MRFYVPSHWTTPLDKLDQPEHPLVRAFTLLAQALWSTNSKEALNVAVHVLREMYLNHVITPIDVAHVLYFIYCSTGVERAKPIERLDDINLLREEIARRVFGGIPLTGDRFRLMLEASPVLTWIKDPYLAPLILSTYSYREIVSEFLIDVIKANGITIDLVEYLLRKREYRQKDSIHDKIFSIEEGVGQYILMDQANFAAVDALAKEYPRRFVNAALGYLEPWRNHVVVMRDVGPMETYRFPHCPMLFEVFRVLTAIVPLLADPSVSSDTKATVGELCLMVPFLMYEVGKLNQRSESNAAIIFDHWKDVAGRHLAHLSAGYLARYVRRDLVDAIVKLWLAKARYELVDSFRRQRLSGEKADQLASMLGGLFILDPERTGLMFNETYEELNNKDSLYRTKTVRNRFSDIINRIFVAWPALSQGIMASWPQVSKDMNRIISSATRSLLTKLA